MSLKHLLRTVAAGAVAAGGTYAYYIHAADPATQFEIMSRCGAVLRLFDPETTHRVGILAAQNNLLPRETRPDPASLATTVWGRTFTNPIGLAAGFDKDAQIVGPLMRMGFGFVEIGSVTPQPQPGNPQPRVFRLPELRAVINRYGFNSLGADAVSDNLDNFLFHSEQESYVRTSRLGVNLGKNKTSKDAATDYSIGVTKLGKFADYIVVNVSSPNTPGLRALQDRRELEELLKAVKLTRDRMRWGQPGPPPLLVKIAPDLTEPDKEDIAAVVMKLKIDGIVVSNTTIQRPGAVSAHPVASEAGGLSGKPLFELSTATLSDMYRLTNGTVPLIGCGGVTTGEDAYKKIRAGASLVQFYTSMVYEGPRVVPDMKQQLARCLERDGFKSVQDAVGADHVGQPGFKGKRPAAKSAESGGGTRRKWLGIW